MSKLLMLFFITMIFVGCSNETPVQVEPEKVSPANETSTYEGKISLSDEVKIFSPVSGNVMERYVEEGSDVTEGQALFKIDGLGPHSDYLQAKKELAQAMTALAKEMSELEQAEKNSSPQEVADKKFAVEARQEEIARLQELIQRMEEAAAGGIIYAPKSGRLAEVAPVGMPVTENESLLAAVGNVNPVVVNVELSETELKNFSAADNLKITLQLGDGSTYSHEGTFKDGAIFFDNPDELLPLGTTARVEIKN